ncbi:MAG: TIM barrel protein [Rhodocyclales bacterium]|nr:TIM barrel protein [Rhodocyclales bacterium]
MARPYSLAFLTAPALTPPEAIRLAADTGYQFVGLRLVPNQAGAPQQHLIGLPDVLRATRAAMAETGVGVFDLEILRIGAGFRLDDCLPLLEVGAELGARAVLVAGDDPDRERLAAHYARLCEAAHGYGLSADLEFMPWTAVRDARDALDVVRRAGTLAGCGLLVDALHAARSTTRPEDLRALPRELLHYAQISDAPVRGPGAAPFSTEEMIHTARSERLLPGEGGIDLAGMFACLPDTLPVSVEIPNLARIPLEGQTRWARLALERSQACLSPLAVA